MFTAEQDCPVIVAAQTSSRGSSVAAWDICARLANNGRELVVIFGTSRWQGSLEVSAALDNAYAYTYAITWRYLP